MILVGFIHGRLGLVVGHALSCLPKSRHDPRKNS